MHAALLLQLAKIQLTGVIRYNQAEITAFVVPWYRILLISPACCSVNFVLGSLVAVLRKEKCHVFIKDVAQANSTLIRSNK